jgi:hypothetical protein
MRKGYAEKLIVTQLNKNLPFKGYRRWFKNITIKIIILDCIAHRPYPTLVVYQSTVLVPDLSSD